VFHCAQEKSEAVFSFRYPVSESPIPRGGQLPQFRHFLRNFVPPVPDSLSRSGQSVLTSSRENTGIMDELHKRYVAKRFLALTEDFEVQKFERDIKMQRPHASTIRIHTALLTCATTLPLNHPRERIMQCVLGKL
jgi:hypothetical protein